MIVSDDKGFSLRNPQSWRPYFSQMAGVEIAANPGISAGTLGLLAGAGLLYYLHKRRKR